jgi:phospholipid-binding lipoprotein MlaA
VLPLVGPSNARDTTGMAVDIFFDPLTYAEYDNKTFWSIARYGAVALDVRARNIETLDAVERSSVDYYAAMRSLYRQRRDNEIRNDKPDPKGLPEFLN